MGLQVQGLAMDRHQHLGLDPGIELAQLAAARVPGDVHQGVIGRDQLDALVNEQVLDVDHFALIAGNGPGREDHPVAGVEIDDWVIAAGDTGDGGARFALTAGADQHAFVARDGLVHILVVHGRKAFEHAQFLGNAHDAVQRPP
ncbi:hypothetical protein D3C87_1551350 [compost metagenome]